MNSDIAATAGFRPFIRFLIQEMKPRGPWLTPFNIISIPVILVGLGILVVRYIYGLGSVTNLSQEFPWGLWMGFDVITGVALAGGAYVITFVVYVMRVEKYHSIVRVTILNGFLAYCFYGGALIFDIGRPWHALNPYIGNKFGFASVLFGLLLVIAGSLASLLLTLTVSIDIDIGGIPTGPLENRVVVEIARCPYGLIVITEIHFRIVRRIDIS